MFSYFFTFFFHPTVHTPHHKKKIHTKPDMVKYLVSITLLATVLATVQAQLKGYPPSDKVPDVKSAQVKAWLKEVDLSGAPKIPIAKGRPGDAPKCNKRQLPNEYVAFFQMVNFLELSAVI